MDQALKEWLLTQASYYIEYLQPKKSIILLEALQHITPNDSNIYRMLSYAYLQDNRFEDSISAADDFLKYTKQKNNRTIKWIKGRALLNIKKQHNN